ncbi:hypothetical protein OH76DRAFT_1489063 [Lentinus brumalis]|uniref:Uncharacterized protein n=1 Tax=Lentinus brumalis TaxID=2498619 RepID=A0A371CNT3_9APHY|nr:hypothetical protein OH76DRAFT_1489063 [Polyporus brumalis]
MPLVQIGEWTEVVLRQTIALCTTFSACAGLSSMQLGLDEEWLPQILEIQKELKELTTAEVLRKECITERPPHARAHEYRGNTIPQLAAILSKTIPVLRHLPGHLFLVPLRLEPYPTPLSNGVLMHRLKDKIGTHGVPTAELELRGTRAWLLGHVNRGVKCFASMLNITRLHSAVHSVGSLQRSLSFARAYAGVRAIKGGTASPEDVLLHVATLSDISVLHRALTHLTFGATVLLGKPPTTEDLATVEGLRVESITQRGPGAQASPPTFMSLMTSLRCSLIEK